MELSEALRKAAETSGLSDVQIAAAVGVGQQTVRAWKRGAATPRVHNLVLLIKVVPGLGPLVGLELAA